MLDLSVGSGILAAVVFIVFIVLIIFTLTLWKDAVDSRGVPFSIFTFTALTLAVGMFLAAILGFIDLDGLIN
jgi:tellurite resistance protein TehA-like permease